MTIVRWDPFKDFLSLQQDMGKLFDRRFGWSGRGPADWVGEWTPAIDMYDTDEEIIVQAELPGLTAQDIDISIKDDALTIKGEKKFSEEVRQENYYRVERRYGSFERTIPLPMEVQRDKIKASVKEGVLKVTLPKAEKAKPKEIKVAVEQSK
jgi:HSP20 family protein